MNKFVKNSCPACGSTKIKNWRELDPEELMLVKKLPRNTEFTAEERERHHFCAKCWHEFTLDSIHPGESWA